MAPPNWHFIVCLLLHQFVPLVFISLFLLELIQAAPGQEVIGRLTYGFKTNHRPLGRSRQGHFIGIAPLTKRIVSRCFRKAVTESVNLQGSRVARETPF